MSYLGSFTLGQTIRASVAWTVDPADADTTGSQLTLTHEEDETIIGPIEADAGAVNEWVAFVTPTKTGTWDVRWVSEPPGGVVVGYIYVS